jgi:hypothetical protein
MPPMRDSDLLFNILTAAALGVVVVLAPSAARLAADEALGFYVSARVANPTPTTADAR